MVRNIFSAYFKVSNKTIVVKLKYIYSDTAFVNRIKPKFLPFYIQPGATSFSNHLDGHPMFSSFRGT